MIASFLLLFLLRRYGADHNTHGAGAADRLVAGVRSNKSIKCRRKDEKKEMPAPCFSCVEDNDKDRVVVVVVVVASSVPILLLMLMLMLMLLHKYVPRDNYFLPPVVFLLRFPSPHHAKS